MKNKIYIDAGKRIRIEREKRNYTREYVSIKTGISAKFLYEIENGMKGFSADTLYKIAKTLEVSSEYILTGKTNNQFQNEIQEAISVFNVDEQAGVLKMIRDISEILKK